MRSDPALATDPPVPDWRALTLPDSWLDRTGFRTPRLLWRALRSMFRDRHRIELPAGLPGADLVPRYARQAFHNLPNGNYSNGLVRHYIVTFDQVMLGRMTRARQRIAGYLAGCGAVLDVGTGGGRTAAAIARAGVPEVWGIDPSPYMLKHAATDHPDVRFVPGLAERTGFADARFDGLGVCFVLHEIPRRCVRHGFREFFRVLRPGGRLAICEPSGAQLDGTFWSQLVRHGPIQAYFHVLARLVYEPYVRAWHASDVPGMLAEAGFEAIEDRQEPPARFIFARKPA